MQNLDFERHIDNGIWRRSEGTSPHCEVGRSSPIEPTKTREEYKTQNTPYGQTTDDQGSKFGEPDKYVPQVGDIG
jgi:hypothetical protein